MSNLVWVVLISHAVALFVHNLTIRMLEKRIDELEKKN